MYLLELEVLSFLDICPEVGLLDPMLVLFLAIQGTSILFSIMAAPIYIPNNGQGFPFLEHFLFVDFLMIAILTSVKGYRFVIFDVHFSDN